MRAVLFFASFLIVVVGATVLASTLRVQADSVLTTVPVGTTPQQIMLTPNGSKLFVSNEAANTVSVISTATDSVQATIGVGTDPGPIRFTPDGSKAYVANALSNSVSVIDVTANAWVKDVAVETDPVTLSRSDDGSKVYVANKVSNTVSVICTGLVPLVCGSTDTVIKTINVGTAPNTMAKTPNGAKLYVSNGTSNNVSVICTGLVPLVCGGASTDTVLTTISVLPSKDPGSIHFLPNGTKGYVANRGCVANGTTCLVSVAPTVSVIDVAGNSVSPTIPVGVPGDAPHAMRITPDGSKLYLVNKHGDEVVVIYTATNIRKYFLMASEDGAGPNTCSDGLDNGLDGFTDAADGDCRAIQLQKGSCFNITFGVGSCPVRIELTPDGSKAYVVEQRPLADNGVLTIICTGVVPAVCGGANTDTVVGTVTLGKSPVDIEIMNGIKAYVGNSVSNTVSVVALTPPRAVGGIVELPDVSGTQLGQPTPRSGGDNLGLYISVAAAVAGAIALAGGIWFARRRLVR